MHNDPISYSIRQRCSTLPARARLVRSGILALACWLLAALSADAMAGYNVWTSQYTFTRQELQSGLAAHFPRDLQYLDLVGIRLSDPQLRLDGSQNRVVTRVHARVSSAVLLPAPIDGVLLVSSGLKYDAGSRSVRLDRPKVEKIDVPGLSPADAAQMNMIGNLVAEQVLANYPLYTFKPEQLRLRGRAFEPRTITVSDGGIAVDIVQLN